MSDNQYVFEIIRDIGYAIQRIKENETLWLNVRNDGKGFFTARGSDYISGGLSETSRAIEIAYKVTRNVVDPRDIRIKLLEEKIEEAENCLITASIGDPMEVCINTLNILEK